MKGSRSGLFLMELIIALLLFAFCAGVCIQIFQSANRETRASQALSKSVFLATSAAEIYKASGGDSFRVAAELGTPGSTPEAINIETPDSGSFVIKLTETGSGHADIDVYASYQEPLIYTLSVKAVK
ncbi:MAG: hypothetical protein LBN97_01020 [Oscillospiraceae bacterium]|jgi:hypothetical protein|nr:hypothetical protein [Oscillospiraceae bacterium]